MAYTLTTYDKMNKYALRAEFKKNHFDLSTTNIDLLFKKYHASNSFYRNSVKQELSPESRKFYNIYKHEVANPVISNQGRFSPAETKNCNDLIHLKYIQKSPIFNTAFADMDTRLYKYVTNNQAKQKSGETTNNMLTVGEVCFVLCLHPELEQAVKNMLPNKTFNNVILKILERGKREASADTYQPTRKISNENMIIRNAWQIGKVK